MDYFKYLLYKRVLSCFALATIFCSCVLAATLTLSLCNIGVHFDILAGEHKYYVANPITIVSFAATFVTVSLTILGFALNNFSKRSKNGETNSLLGNSLYEEAVGILLVRYRRKSTTLLFLNVFNFPLLGKAFSLVLLLGCMLVHCFVGECRVFYLIIYAALMFAIIVSMLVCVFEIYSDINYTTFRACRILMVKIRKRLNYLRKTNKKALKNEIRQVLRRYARTDVFRGIIFLEDALSQILYKPAIFDISWVKNKKGNHILSELAICTDSSYEMMHGIVESDKETQDLNVQKIQKAFEFFVNNRLKFHSSLKEDVEEEIAYLTNITETDYYYASRDKIIERLKPIYDTIKAGEKKNDKEQTGR